jgi:exosome complex exonuclease RRP6
MELDSQTSSMSSETFDEFNSTLQGLALKATKRSLALPPDLAFHRSMDTDLAKSLDVFSSRILSVTNRLLSLISASDGSGRTREMLVNQDDVLDHFRSRVVDPVDHLLERAVSLAFEMANFV